MDQLDKEILSVLTRDGKIQLSELSRKTNLSVSSCQRRIKNMEEDGTIVGYEAVLNPKAIGKGFQALVFVSLAQATQEKISEFEAALQKVDCVAEAHRIFGEQDYVLLIATNDLSDYQKAYDLELSSLPHIKKLETTLLMKEVIPFRMAP